MRLPKSVRPGKHEDGFKPLFAVQHVINGPSIFRPSVQKDAGDGVSVEKRLNKFTPIALVPDTIALECRFEIQLTFFLKIDQVRNGFRAKFVTEFFGHSLLSSILDGKQAEREFIGESA